MSAFRSAVLILLFPLAALAATVKGVVRDPNGQPLAGVRVVLDNGRIHGDLGRRHVHVRIGHRESHDRRHPQRIPDPEHPRDRGLGDRHRTSSHHRRHDGRHRDPRGRCHSGDEDGHRQVRDRRPLLRPGHAVAAQRDARRSPGTPNRAGGCELLVHDAARDRHDATELHARRRSPERPRGERALLRRLHRLRRRCRQHPGPARRRHVDGRVARLRRIDQLHEHAARGDASSTRR